MSTTALPFENGIRHIILFDAVAPEATMKLFVSGASNKELGIYANDGTASTATKDMLFAKKSSSGVLSKSDLITAKDIKSLRSSAPSAKIGKKQLPKIETVTVGKVYYIDFRINYSTLPEHFFGMVASAIAVTGDTATTLMTKLAVNLSEQLNNNIQTGYQGQRGTELLIAGTNVPINRYFRLTQAAGVLTIQEKDFVLDTYVTGIRSFDQLMWSSVVKTSDDTLGMPSALMSITEVAGKAAKGQGYQLRELEHYLGSHVKTFGYADRTLGFQGTYESDLAGQYYTIDIAYNDTGRDDPQILNKGALFASTSMIEINKVGAAIAAAGGPAWVPFA